MDAQHAVILAWRWSFLPLLYVQAGLMHPCFRDDRLARITRLLVAPIIVYTSLTVYRHTLVEPVELNVAVNLAAVGGACAAFALLSIQLALVGGPWYRVVDSGDHKKNDDAPANGRDPAKANGNASTDLDGSPDEKADPSYFELASFAHSMIHHPRNIGWQNRFPERIVLRPRPESPWRFAAWKIPGIVTLHLIMVAGSAVLEPARSIKEAAGAWTYWTGKEPSLLVRRIMPRIVTLMFGLAGYAAISLQYSLTSAALAVITQCGHTLLPTLIAPFDTSQWPPLFQAPYACTSLTQLWTTGWHSMLRRHLEFCGSKPLQMVFQPFGKTVSRVAGILGAFALSGLFHEYGLFIAAGFDPTMVTFQFFFAQGLGVILEVAWYKATGRKVGGPLGWCWGLSWLVWWAQPMVAIWHAFLSEPLTRVLTQLLRRQARSGYTTRASTSARLAAQSDTRPVRMYDAVSRGCGALFAAVESKEAILKLDELRRIAMQT